MPAYDRENKSSRMRKSYFKTYYLLIFIFWCEIEEECAKEEVREGERIYISARSACPALMY
jgi:hypothetical protein